MTSSTGCTATRGEIPVIIGHHLLFTNSDQLFSCCRHERCRAESAVCQCCWTTTRRRRRQSPSRRSALHAILLCRHVELAIASHAPRSSAILSRGVDEPAPSLYLLNAAALSKSHAIEMLTTDLNNHCVDVAVITETHFKSKRSASSTLIPGCCTFRKDRRDRKGGVWQFTSVQPCNRSSGRRRRWTMSLN